MQSKALAGLLALLFAAVPLSGCGGDGEEGSDRPAATAQETGPSAAAAEKLRQARKRFEEEKQRRKKPQAQSAEGQSDSPPPPPPDIDHDDSGGGAAQFRSNGGDNSIQDFGSEADDSERGETAEVLHAYLDSRAARQWDTACSYMSAQIKESLERLASGAGQTRGCAQILAALSGEVPQRALDDAAKADVGSLRTRGSRGLILYHGAGNEDYVMPMVIEDGAWKVAALEGSPLV